MPDSHLNLWLELTLCDFPMKILLLVSNMQLLDEHNRSDLLHLETTASQFPPENCVIEGPNNGVPRVPSFLSPHKWKNIRIYFDICAMKNNKI